MLTGVGGISDRSSSLLPGLERYVQNPVLIATTNDGAVEGPPGFDGFASMWFTDMSAFDAAADAPVGSRPTVRRRYFRHRVA